MPPVKPAGVQLTLFVPSTSDQATSAVNVESELICQSVLACVSVPFETLNAEVVIGPLTPVAPAVGAVMVGAAMTGTTTDWVVNDTAVEYEETTPVAPR